MPLSEMMSVAVPAARATRCGGRRSAAAAIGVGLLGVFAAASAAPPFSTDDTPTGWVTRPALSSNDLRSGNEVIYRADYRSGTWAGTISANHINADGVTLTTSPWALGNTAAILAGVNWDTGRRIFTVNATGTPTTFRWQSLPDSQRKLLSKENVLKYVRGERKEEAPDGAKLRTRFSVQGETLHSTLIYWKHMTGERRLYVGANDGMLHAFDAANGSEVFAYVPSMLLNRLSRLTATPYEHTLFVDGGLAVADVTLASGVRTLLAGALGGGGKGLFMLDVTSPNVASETTAAAASLIKWEITPGSAGFANLGYTHASPRLARLNDGTAAVVVGNGYQNAGNGRATLLLINADTGALIREIDTGSGTTASPNGLSTPTLVDSNLDGRADYAYAGDIDGNLWRFDLTSTSKAAWSVTKLHATSPMQAITVAPMVTKHPMGGRMVLFGTGRTLSEPDMEDEAVHYAYGIWDGAPTANVALLEQTLTEVTVGGKRLRTLSSLLPNWSSGGNLGWRLPLPAGERIVGDHLFVSDDRFYFTSTNPTVVSSTMTGVDGANWLMEVLALTGGAAPRPIFDINADAAINAEDNVSGAVVAGKFLGEGVVSQAVLVDQTSFAKTLFSRQADLNIVTPPASSETGVAGGHFDLDIYEASGMGGSAKSIKHTHQYDDKYNVTGVDFLNASDPAYNLSNLISLPTRFKVLVMNQYLNPASQLSVGGGAFVSIKSYGSLVTAANAAAALAGLPVYDMASLTTLSWKVPQDAFAAKDWWGDGGPVRAGLIPSTTGCVKENKPGLFGEYHNGAMTIQIIRHDTPSTALEYNHSGNDPKYGWRVKAADIGTYVLAEYTAFWHKGGCYGDGGWIPNPARDAASKAKSKAPSAVATDPYDGTSIDLPPGVNIKTSSVTVVGNVTTVTIEFSDKKIMTTKITVNGDGTETVVVTNRAGTVTTTTRQAASRLETGRNETLVQSRRLNWREVVRP